ncbi:MAG: acetoin utilization protein AcuC [Gammaproteobacteria bacterium]
MGLPPVLFLGEALSTYHFGAGHPFGPQRYPAFVQEAQRRGLTERVAVRPPAVATRAELERFHAPGYVQDVEQRSRDGAGFLDCGDTPAFVGAYEAAAAVVGTTLAGVRLIMDGSCRRAFNPIGGLHHARRDRAAGFCVFNDCGVAVESLRADYGIERIAYVDIDAHHGDGVYYAFEADPGVFVMDLHEDGHYLYPGTGSRGETGVGAAAGTKLNIPLPPGAGDPEFLAAWERVEAFLADHPPAFILFQCGADSLEGDPITHLRYSQAAHAHAATRLCQIADVVCGGRVLAMGGGGYNTANLARAWCAVLSAFVECA